VYDKLGEAGLKPDTCQLAAKQLTNEQQIVRKQLNDKWWMILPHHLPGFLEKENSSFKPDPVMPDDQAL
jgi:hypothetical protein